MQSIESEPLLLAEISIAPVNELVRTQDAFAYAKIELESAKEAILIGNGHSYKDAIKMVETERINNPEEFEQQIWDYSDYSRRITRGDGAIPKAIFDEFSYTYPETVLADVAKWVQTRDALALVALNS